MEILLTHLRLQPLPMQIGSLAVEAKTLVLGSQNSEVIGHEEIQESLSRWEGREDQQWILKLVKKLEMYRSQLKR